MTLYTKTNVLHFDTQKNKTIVFYSQSTRVIDAFKTNQKKFYLRRGWIFLFKDKLKKCHFHHEGTSVVCFKCDI